MGAVGKRRNKTTPPQPPPPPPSTAAAAAPVRRGPFAAASASSAASNRSVSSSSTYSRGGSVFSDSSSDVDPRSLATTPESSVPTTPYASAPPTPYGSVREVLLRWAGERSAKGANAALSEPKVRLALDALRRGRHDAPWATAYDALLVGLAERGGALAQAQLVASYLRQDAGQRVATLHRAAQAGALFGHEAEALATVSLLRRLKHDHGTKQRLLAIQDALSRAPKPQAATAAAASTDAPAPAANLPGAPATLAVRKRILQLTPAQARGLSCGTVSVLSAADGAGGAPLLLLGSTLDQGSFSKVKPVALLPAGRALLGGDAGRWVARRTHSGGREDAAKYNLRGSGYRATQPIDPQARGDEADALEAAGSELRPVLRMADEAGNTYELVRRMHGTTEQALSIDPRLREGPMLGRRVLSGVLTPLVALHATNRAHFDLKPENLFVDVERAEVVLGDFGLSEELRAERAYVRGTYRFEAPEMYAAMGRGLTPQSDLYGLAYTLAVLLTPGKLLRSPLYLLPHDALPKRRPELAAQAAAELARLGLPNTPMLRERATTGLALRESSATYRAWYDERHAQLENAQSGEPPAGWQKDGLDGLFAALLQRDPLLARLVARGLHPDVAVRGTAAAWLEALQKAPPVPQQERDAWAERLARANGNNGLSAGANAAMDELARLAENFGQTTPAP